MASTSWPTLVLAWLMPSGRRRFVQDAPIHATCRTVQHPHTVQDGYRKLRRGSSHSTAVRFSDFCDHFDRTTWDGVLHIANVLN